MSKDGWRNSVEACLYTELYRYVEYVVDKLGVDSQEFKDLDKAWGKVFLRKEYLKAKNLPPKGDIKKSLDSAHAEAITMTENILGAETLWIKKKTNEH